jgi:hypothetical protein
MTFEEWEDKWLDDHLGKHPSAADAWDAATYAANTRVGDASNEAEKDARRKVAMDALSDRDFTDAELDTIIKVAQG